MCVCFLLLLLQVFLQTTSVWQVARRKIQERLRAVYLLGLAWILLAFGSNVINILYRSREAEIQCNRENVIVFGFLVLGKILRLFHCFHSEQKIIINK